LGVQDAFFEGKKAEETSPRKSTPRTLKEVDQQYPGVNRAPEWKDGFDHATQQLQHWLAQGARGAGQ
jgi:hypothetical protein